MEVWIRSQDKEWFQQVRCVCYTSTISYLEFDDDEEMVGQVIHKRGHGIRCDGIFFGEYPTKERCLEIIDEIQSLFGYILLGSVSANGGVKKEYHQRDTAVYEMPKE